MRIAWTKPLFAWDELEDSPTLKSVQQFLESIPDAALLEGLQQWRGRGRDDYPVRVLWGALLLSIVLRHPTREACLAELRRNAGLRRLIGIEHEDQVPKPWNLTRFLNVLGQEPHLSRLRAIFDQMVSRLAGAVDDLGRHTAGDSSGLSARRSSSKKKSGALPEPAGGRKEYQDDQGQVTHVVEWFGYKFHLLVDVKHEVVLSYRITSTKVGDNEALPDLVAQARANLPAGRIETLAYDKAADDGKVHELLDEADIAPLIQNRSCWQSEPERKLPGHDGRSNIVYDESGTLYCYDQQSTPPVRHRMAYIGHEPARKTLKYRCPARHEGWHCPMSAHCNAGRPYGLTVRVKREIDLRRFPPIPRATKKFERLYKGRTAVERVNGRLKVYWGADDGNVVGPQRFFALLSTIMVVHIGTATLLAAAPRSDKTLGRMDLTPVAKALRQACSV